MKKLLFASAVSIFLTACGSGAGSDSSNSSLQNQESSIDNGSVSAPDQTTDTSDSTTTDTTDPGTSTDPSTGTDTGTVTNPDPTPTPPPGVEAVAMYSYTNDVSTAVPLAGATLEPQTVYIFWQGVEANSVTYYCCKGISGDAAGEGHSPAVTVNSAPYTLAVDLSTYTTAGSRELYVDYMDSNGTLQQNNITNFAVAVDTSSSSNPAYTVDAQLEWVAPSLREDGTDLASTDIAYYGIIYTDPDGNIHTQQIDKSKTSWPVTLSEGTYDFAIYAADSNGLKSQSSTLSCNISATESSCI